MNQTSTQNLSVTNIRYYNVSYAEFLSLYNISNLIYSKIIWLHTPTHKISVLYQSFAPKKKTSYKTNFQ